MAQSVQSQLCGALDLLFVFTAQKLVCWRQKWGQLNEEVGSNDSLKMKRCLRDLGMPWITRSWSTFNEPSPSHSWYLTRKWRKNVTRIRVLFQKGPQKVFPWRNKESISLEYFLRVEEQWKYFLGGIISNGNIRCSFSPPYLNTMSPLHPKLD